MCDYSLHAVATRAAEVGETLVSTKFRLTPTRGFAGIDSPDVAVCLRPGTALAFDNDVRHARILERDDRAVDRSGGRAEGNGPAIACDPNRKARGAGAFSSRRGGVDLVEC